jgi:hypothetical protein
MVSREEELLLESPRHRARSSGRPVAFCVARILLKKHQCNARISSNKKFIISFCDNRQRQFLAIEANVLHALVTGAQPGSGVKKEAFLLKKSRKMPRLWLSS